MMIIPKQILMAATLSAFSVSATAKDLMGYFECTAKSISITKMNDGRVETFSGWNGGYNVGDRLWLVYEYRDALGTVSLTLDYNDDHLFFGSYEPKSESPNWVFLKDTVLGNELMFGDDSLNATALSDTLQLRRYYKSDWDGYFVRIDDRFSETIGLDCRTKDDQYEQLKKFTTK